MDCLPTKCKYHIEQNVTPNCLCSWLSGVTERYLPIEYYTQTEIQTDIVQKKTFAKHTTLTGEKSSALVSQFSEVAKLTTAVKKDSLFRLRNRSLRFQHYPQQFLHIIACQKHVSSIESLPQDILDCKNRFNFWCWGFTSKYEKLKHKRKKIGKKLIIL